MIKVCGITGVLGSGKSYVSSLFSMYGVVLYSTDNASKSVQMKVPELRAKIVEKFGTGYFDGAHVNKEFAKSLFFGSTEEHRENLRWITETVGEYVLLDFLKFKQQIIDNADPHTNNYILVESAILFETGFDMQCDYVVGVRSPNPVMKAYERDYTTKEEWDVRMATQLPEDQKRYDFIIGNDYTKAVEALVSKTHEQILQRIHDGVGG